MRAGLGALAALLIVTVLIPGIQAQASPVLVARIQGEITRATVEYVKAAIEVAEAEGARALVLRLDTPGGGPEETQQIQKLFLATPVPILGWVAPSGVSAWSAGTILLESSDLAAMAPFTTIGSVQPVGIGAGGFEPVTEPKILNAIEGGPRGGDEGRRKRPPRSRWRGRPSGSWASRSAWRCTRSSRTPSCPASSCSWGSTRSSSGFRRPATGPSSFSPLSFFFPFF